MMLTPCWPSAVPTGGAGVACPALIWSLTIARTFLRLRGAASAIFPFPSCGSCGRVRPASRRRPFRLRLRHLVEGELDRRLPVEDVDQDLELRLLDVDLRDGALEVGERPGDDPHGVALFPLQPVLRLALRFLLYGKDLLHLAGRQRGWLRPGP